MAIPLQVPDNELVEVVLGGVGEVDQDVQGKVKS
jgi:hypothetical protein